MGFFESLGVVAPVFGIIGLGFFAAQRGFFSQDAIAGLHLFVFTFAIPAFLFRTMAGIDLPSEPPWRLWAVYYGSIALVWCLSLAVSFIRRLPIRERIVFAFGSGFSNTVLVGIPVVVLALGERAALPLFLIFSIHGLTLFTTTILALESARGDLKWQSALREGLRSAAANPVILALALGLLYSASGASLPVFADRFLMLLGGAGIPAALFVMGASLTRYRLSDSYASAALMSVLKLGVHPLLVYGLGRFVFDLPDLWLKTAVLLAAIPCGIFAFILADRYKAGAGAASGAVFLSTLVSVVTLPLVIAWLLSS